MNWQPIASAPKDGTAILVSGCNGHRHVTVAVWREMSLMDNDYHEAGWWSPIIPAWLAEPRQWMPFPSVDVLLPPAPTKEAQK